MTFKDKSGREVKPGDLIVYGHALGRCAGLRYGKAIEVSGPKKKGYGDYAKTVSHLKVRGVDDDWQHNAPKLLSKDSTLQFGERVLVIERSQVPAVILALLDKVAVDK